MMICKFFYIEGITSLGVSVIIGVLVGTSEGDGEGVTVELTT